eukprot:IDg12485t1
MRSSYPRADKTAIALRTLRNRTGRASIRKQPTCYILSVRFHRVASVEEKIEDANAIRVLPQRRARGVCMRACVARAAERRATDICCRVLADAASNERPPARPPYSRTTGASPTEILRGFACGCDLSQAAYAGRRARTSPYMPLRMACPKRSQRYGAARQA